VWELGNSVLEIPVSFLGIHKWEPDIYIGFSPVLHMQCGYVTVGVRRILVWYLKGRRCLITSCQTKYWLLPGSAVCPEAKSKVIKSTLTYRVKVDSGIVLPIVNVLGVDSGVEFR
jgi:hypothetical protein